MIINNLLISGVILLIIGEKYGCLEIMADSSEFLQQIESDLEKEIEHYKCKCIKCGKMRYYSEATLRSKPQFCYRPIYCTNTFRYSTKAQDATYRKKKKYQNNESVCLVYDKDELVPSDAYCGKWNEKREKEMQEQAEKEAAIIASIPRIKAKNYDCQYVGEIYESLEILECINEEMESAPQAFYTQRHQKCYSSITVYKQYRCRCYLCGREQSITCDKFGIFPPTEYGATAYNGYWSEVYCDCHPISSFQWIVNKLLIDNSVPYRVEVAFPDLYGIYGENLLRFDFCVYYKDGSIKCLIECQGEHHYKPVEEFGGESQYNNQVKNDELKREYAREHDITLIEISYKDKRFERVREILKKEGIIE